MFTGLVTIGSLPMSAFFHFHPSRLCKGNTTLSYCINSFRGTEKTYYKIIKNLVAVLALITPINRIFYAGKKLVRRTKLQEMVNVLGCLAGSHVTHWSVRIVTRA